MANDFNYQMRDSNKCQNFCNNHRRGKYGPAYTHQCISINEGYFEYFNCVSVCDACGQNCNSKSSFLCPGREAPTTTTETWTYKSFTDKPTNTGMIVLIMSLSFLFAVIICVCVLICVFTVKRNRRPVVAVHNPVFGYAQPDTSGTMAFQGQNYGQENFPYSSGGAQPLNQNGIPPQQKQNPDISWGFKEIHPAIATNY